LITLSNVKKDSLFISRFSRGLFNGLEVSSEVEHITTL